MGKKRVLLVEDEIIIARDIYNMLIHTGYEVVAVVNTAAEAIQKAEKLKPDVVLMDIMLESKRAGIDAANYIYFNIGIPIIYMTSYTDKVTVEKAIKSEPFGYLLKPFEERELQTNIEVALYKFQMEKKLKERERWLSTILISIREGVVATNVQGRVTFLNPLAEKLIGVNADEALGKLVNHLVHIIDENTQKKIAIPIKAITKGKNFTFPPRCFLKGKNGQTTPVAPLIAPIKNEHQEITGLVLTLANIQAQRKAEEERLESLEQLTQSMTGIIQALATTIEMRDPYTAGHQRRVAHLASAIAEKMGLPPEKIKIIKLAAEVHDIGKIHVPAEILSKPGKISEVEFNLIKTHPQVGYEVLKNIDFPWPIADIVHQHHERLDGSGYPQGLKNGQILLEARIIAVADVVEAMASHRPYRPAKKIQEALQEIDRQKGKLYDPKVVKACLQLFQEGFLLCP
ncbi:MAG: histidine kinase [Candidatus Aminicenantes bacterium 4484_214]|nr:MAG: histidine kinase [Candidatus Aminicenantes bacterium 4484_214]RLE07352.1 MAG: histidine kinase [Candidatus Aminicenantes bacterium]